MKTILSIIPFLYTEKDLFHVREQLRGYPSHHFFKSLPEWCVREDNGFIDYTASYHQFTGTIVSDDLTKGYHLFDINPVDEILKQEISNVGIEELFGWYDWRPLFSHIIPNEDPNNSIRIPNNTHIVVDIRYDGNGDDFDIYTNILGFLDGKMDLYRI